MSTAETSEIAVFGLTDQDWPRGRWDHSDRSYHDPFTLELPETDVSS